MPCNQCIPPLDRVFSRSRQGLFTLPEVLYLILDGVTITFPELGIGACATLFLKGGIIDFLEIWSYDGEYPAKELSSYTLKQEGDYGSDREITQNGPVIE